MGLAGIDLVLAFAAPLGSILCTDITLLSKATRGEPRDLVGGVGGPASLTRIPSFHPHLAKARSRQVVDLAVVEVVRGVQYDVEAIPDTCSVRGKIVAKAVLDGLPELSLGVPSLAQVEMLALDECVSMYEPTTGKLSFLPPLTPKPVVSYTVPVSAPGSLPIRGYYQATHLTPHVVDVLIQLLLSVKSTVSSCEVHIPFYNHGQITHVDLRPDAGVVNVSSDRRSLIWILSERWSIKNPEVTLPGKITFASPYIPSPGDAGRPFPSPSPSSFYTSSPPPPVDQLQSVVASGVAAAAAAKASAPGPGESVGDDPFCVGNNMYITLDFVIANTTLSGVEISRSDVSLYPKTKAKMVIDHSLVSSEYVIWNSLGASRSAPCLQDLLQ